MKVILHMLRCASLHPRTQLQLPENAATLTHTISCHKDGTSHGPENCQDSQSNREEHWRSYSDDDEKFAESLSGSINRVCFVTGDSLEELSILRGKSSVR